MAWYQGDIETDGQGEGHQLFVGRFNIETFIVAQPPGGQPAPVVHNQPPFPDASTNPATEPIHTFHLGLWFGSPLAAQAAGCPNTVTRFNGDHNAGIQALSTRNFGNALRTPKAVDALIEVDHKSGSLTSPSTSEATPNRCAMSGTCVSLRSRTCGRAKIQPWRRYATVLSNPRQFRRGSGR